MPVVFLSFLGSCDDLEEVPCWLVLVGAAVLGLCVDWFCSLDPSEMIVGTKISLSDLESHPDMRVETKRLRMKMRGIFTEGNLGGMVLQQCIMMKLYPKGAYQMDKKTFRKTALLRLRIVQRCRWSRDHHVRRVLYEMIQAQQAKAIMFYVPMSIEVDVKPLIQRLRREGYRIYVPFMEGASFRLVQWRLPLVKNRFGIWEPKDSRRKIEAIDLAVIPIVGTDPTLRRIGFGKGMYDRFFAQFYKRIKKSVFVSRTLCMSRSVITQAHDVQACSVVTPERTIETQYRHRGFKRGKDHRSCP
jgi:5-formyltetrahydrofolate cyclo-ligase